MEMRSTAMIATRWTLSVRRFVGTGGVSDLAYAPGRFFRRVAISLAVTTALAVGAVSASSASAVPAASTPGWRITQVSGTQFESISPLNGHDAWLVGSDSGSLYLETWNGSTWRPAKQPAGLDVNVYQASVDAVSPADVWLFPAVSKSTGNVEYAMYWNGHKWATKFTLGSTVDLLSDAIFGPSNVWLFGQKLGTPGPSGWGQPYAEHYDGSTWRQSSLPIDVLMVSKISASDVWAVGPSAKSTAFLAVRWTGKAWTKPLTVASPAKVNGDGWSVTSSFAQSPTSLWVLERLNVTNRGTGQEPPGSAILHWNGHKWSVITENLSYYLYRAEPDGNGGFWVPGSKTESSPAVFAHYSGGRWTYQPVPTKSGYTAGVANLELIPGTHSLWAVGVLNPVKNGLTEFAILKYGP